MPSLGATMTTQHIGEKPNDVVLALKVTNLVVSYGAKRAVNGVNLEIKVGEIFGLLGPNGPARPAHSALWKGCCDRPRAPS